MKPMLNVDDQRQERPASAWERVARRILLRLSNDRYKKTEEQIAREETEHTISEVERSHTLGFLTRIEQTLDFTGRTVLDIGCGSGALCVELAKRGAKRVLGVDIDPNRIAAATALARAERVSDVATFFCGDFISQFQPGERVDIAVSTSAFEHIPDPLIFLRKIRHVLSDGGTLWTIFGPLWGSPYGAHMWEFTKIPWVHFLFPERVVLEVRWLKYRPGDPATRYEDVKGHLNRLTVAQFERYARDAGFDTRVLRVNPAQDRGIYRLPNKVVNAVPILRELGSLQLLAVLESPPMKGAVTTPRS